MSARMSLFPSGRQASSRKLVAQTALLSKSLGTSRALNGPSFLSPPAPMGLEGEQVCGLDHAEGTVAASSLSPYLSALHSAN